MTRGFFGALCMLTLATLVGLPAAGEAQAPAEGWTAPRTVHGHPDLQGVWANNSATPLQRPAALADRETLTDEEVARLKATADELFALDANDAAFGDSVFTAALAAAESFSSADTQTGNYNQFWMVERNWDNRTSLIVDPPDGRLPQRTAAAEARMEAYNAGRQRHAQWTDDRSLGERCITFGAPRLGAGYNSYYQIFQTADHVVLLMEMAHDARIIPLADRPPLDDDIRLWHGDSRGRWEGETLVVETANYSPKTYFMAAQDNLRIEERFTRVGAGRAGVRGAGRGCRDVGRALDRGHPDEPERGRPLRVRLPRRQHRHGGHPGRGARARARGGGRRALT